MHSHRIQYEPISNVYIYIYIYNNNYGITVTNGELKIRIRAFGVRRGRSLDAIDIPSN